MDKIYFLIIIIWFLVWLIWKGYESLLENGLFVDGKRNVKAIGIFLFIVLFGLNKRVWEG